jgi:CRP-like cAMP-binding protein
VADQEIQDRYLELLRRNADVETYAAGDTVFSEGELADRMYIVANGSVSLHVGGSVVEVVGPSRLFGEMAVIDREPRSATAVTDSETELVAIDKRRFWFLVQETPFFAEIVMRTMAGRIRHMNAAIS